MADLFGLSPADRDVLMRMIARERANYTSDVRSLAPVPRPRVIYQPSKPAVCAYMSGAAASITFNAVGANKIPWGAMWYTDESTLSVGTHSFSGVDYYEHFLAHKAGVYFVDVIVNVNANFSYSMTSPITGLGAAMDDFDMEALVTDKDDNDFSPLHTSRHRLVMRGSAGSSGMRHSVHHLWAVRLTDESKAPYKISTTHAANDYNSKAYTYTLERGVTRCWYAGPGGS